MAGVRLGRSGAVAATLLFTSAALPGSENEVPAQGPTAVEHRLAAIAILPAATFLEGPTSGQFIPGRNGVEVPFAQRQPVQGISALTRFSGRSRLLAMSDNGYGGKENSPDYLLRLYLFEPSYRTGSRGEGTIAAAHYFVLHDADRKVGFPIVAEMDHYPGPGAIPVDATIRERRLLTGADLDIESFRRVPDGTFWFGDEFGPFLVPTTVGGRLLRAPVPLPGVKSPQSPHLGDDTPNAQRSGGFEAMALSADGRWLYPMLEMPLVGDPEGQLNIYRFDPMAGEYTSDRPYRKYKLEPEGIAVAELVAISENTYLTIERDAEQGPTAKHKKVFLVDFRVTDDDGYLVKRELVDLLRLPDPGNVGGHGQFFTFPFVTIEAIAVVDERTLAIVNDNNYPFSVGRHVAEGAPDDTELILIRFTEPLGEMSVLQ